MARLKNGINGPFSGKAGSVVGCCWKATRSISRPMLLTNTQNRTSGK